MEYQKSNTICDYVELHFQDASVSNNEMTWNIPNTYFSNLRSPIAEVCLVESSVDTSVNVNLNVKWLGSVHNGYNSRNRGLIMGHLIRNFDGGTTTKYYLRETSSIKIITPARPQTITLSVVTPDDVTAEISSNGFFTLKFEYLDPVAVVEDLTNTRYGRGLMM